MPYLPRWTCLLLLTLLFGSPLSAQVLSVDPLQASLDESSKALANLERAKEQIPAAAGERDKRGLSLRDDLQQNFMLPETQKQLKSLQASATADLQEKDIPGAQVNLASMRQILAAEIERYTAISDYWRDKGTREGLEEQLRLAEPEVAKEIDSLATQFDQQIAARDFVTAMRTTWIKLAALRWDLRHREEQRLLASIEAGELPTRRSVGLGKRKCTPAERTSGSDKPDFRKDEMPRGDAYYPRGKARALANQTVEMLVIVGTTGCAERVFLMRGAERPEFDEGALQLAADGRYFPAERDGKPVRSGLTFRIRF